MKRKRQTIDPLWLQLSDFLWKAGALGLAFGYFVSPVYYVLGGLAMVASVTIPQIIQLLEEERIRRAGMDEIDRMTGEEFERWLVHFFKSRGYQAKRTPDRGDWGADVILAARDGRKIAVQAKRWDRSVGVAAVQEVTAARAHYGCDEAMVITNSSFTDAAIELARSNNVKLWDRERLIREILAGHSR